MHDAKVKINYDKKGWQINLRVGLLGADFLRVGLLGADFLQVGLLGADILQEGLLSAEVSEMLECVNHSKCLANDTVDAVTLNRWLGLVNCELKFC